MIGLSEKLPPLLYDEEAIYASFSSFDALKEPENRELVTAYKEVSEKIANSTQSDEQLQELVARQQELISQISYGNAGLVMSIAQEYKRKYYMKSDLYVEDLIQEGMIGLLRALDLFEPERGTNFSTYAVPWIKSKIRRYIYTNDTIRIPEDEQKRLHIQSRNVEASFSPLQLHLMTLALSALSIHQIDGFLEDSEDQPIDRNFLGKSVWECLLQQFTYEEIQEILVNVLTPTEQLVVELYFGINPTGPLLFEEIGDKIGKTRQRAHQLYQSAIEKLQAYVETHQLALSYFLGQ